MSDYQDYYKTLGVDKNASQDEIQRAYRKLTRKYHPDISKAKNAEEKFKQINEAYEALGDPEKRSRYDQVGSCWDGRFTGQNTGGGENVRFHFSSSDPGQFSEFFRNLFGGDWGAGEEYDVQGGGGRRRRGRDQEAVVSITLAEAYHGVKKSVDLERLEFGGDGKPVRARRTFEVTIPQGVTDGSLIRLAGQGGSGSGGGEAGDLYLKITIHPDDRFRLDGHNLVATVSLSPWEAALGGKIPVATLDGHINLTIPPGTQSGQTLRARGKGMPVAPGTYGDLMVTVRIAVPKHLTAKERRLFEELAAESRFNPRQ